MNGKKNGGYGCGSVIAVILIFGFLAEALPTAIAFFAIAVVVIGLYKNFSNNKKNGKELQDREKAENAYSFVGENFPDSEGKDMDDKIYRKNKLISEQNWEISEKNKEIEKLKEEVKTLKNEKKCSNKEIILEHMDEYFWDAGKLVIENDKASVGMLQRVFKIGFNRTARIMDELYEAGVVGEEIGTAPRKVLMEIDEFDHLRICGLVSEKPEKEESVFPHTLQMDRIDLYNNKIDYMTGEDFEAYVAQILGRIGFYNVQTTKGSGDQGVDILAEKNGMKYAFQCKRYDKPVGNKAVQEVFSGKFFYHCHTAVVVTNNYFTQSAKDLAYENGVVLWDRDYMQKFIGEQNEETKIHAENDIFTQYNENREKGELRILDIEERIIAIEDGEVSRYLYQYLETASRIAIDMYLKNGDRNTYTEDMIRNVEKPILLYNVKCQKLIKYVLSFTYYCKMNQSYKNTDAYKKISEAYSMNEKKFKDDLFNISVYYNVEDILFENKEVKINNVPEVNISTDTIDGIKLLEDIDEYDLQTGVKYLVTENFFPMKMDNMKFE